MFTIYIFIVVISNILCLLIGSWLLIKRKITPLLLMMLSAIIGAGVYQSSMNHSIWKTITTQTHSLIFFSFLLFCMFIIFQAMSSTITGLLYFNIIIMLTSIASYIKVSIRSEPILWSDLTNGLVKEVVWDMVLKKYQVIVLLFIILILIVTWYTMRISNDYQSLYTRLFKGGVAAVCLVMFVRSPTAVMMKMGVQIYPNNNEMNVKKNGPGLFFFMSKDGTIMPKPDDYNEKNMEQLINEIISEFPIEKSEKSKEEPTIIYLLSEALTDPLSYKEAEWKEDPMPTIRQLQKQGGWLLSPSFGGGTANTEFSILTNMSYDLLSEASLPYTYIYENRKRGTSMVESFNSLGYTTTAIHPYWGKSYNRKEVFNSFGFDQSLFIEDMVNIKEPALTYTEGYISDYSLNQLIIDQVNQSNDPQFIHTISMQNHFDYVEKQKGTLSDEENILLNEDKLPDGKKLAYYARGVKKTDSAIQFLLQSLEKMDKEIYLVVYGDHLPSFGDKFNEEVTINTHEDKEIAKYMTPYFIWNNQGKALKTETIMNPEFITASLLKQSGITLPSFYQFVAKFSEELSGFKHKEDIYFSTSKQTSKLTSEEKIKLRNYQLLMYDMLAGQQYAKELFELPPSEEKSNNK